MRDFLKKNFNVYHVVGVVVFAVSAVFYWLKIGKNSELLLKNSLVLMIIWGILVGYITADLVKNAIDRNKNK